MYKIISALVVAMVTIISDAQTISGALKDQLTGEPIVFASIYNKNNATSTQSNSQGKFEVEALVTDTLVIRSFGYKEISCVAGEASSIGLLQEIVSLNEVVVTTNREQVKRTEAPIAISSISSQTIQDNKPTTIDQVLNQVQGVNMVDLGNEQHTMSIRRQMDYGASYLYLEDGLPIRASGVFNHNALLEINMANVSKIELVRGPVSSMYGSEAIGGAVNFITYRPTLKPTVGVSMQSSNIGYFRTDFNASTTINKLGIRIAGYKAYQRNGYREHSDFDKLALSISANYKVSEKGELVLSSTYVDYMSDMTGSLDSTDFFDKAYSSVHTFTNRGVTTNRTKLAYNHYWSDSSKSVVTAYVRDNSITQNPSYRVKDDFIPWKGKGDKTLAHGEENDNAFKSYGLIAQHNKEFKKLAILGGASVDYSPNSYVANYIQIHKTEDGVYDSFTSTDSMLVDYKVNLVNTAAYLQLKYTILKGLNVIGALRYDHFNYQFDNNLDSNAFTAVLDGQNSYKRVTPKMGITYNPFKNIGVYANYAQGFVPPQVSELYRGQKVPTLVPVYYDNYEFGSWLSFLKQKGKVELAWYRMDGQNELVSVLQDDGTSTQQNVGKTHHEGIEYAVQYQLLEGLVARINGTYARHTFTNYITGKDTLTGNDIALAPKNSINSQITYKPNFFKGFRTSLEWQWIDRYFMDNKNTKTYNGYNVLNLRFGYELENMDVWFNVMNITNEVYATVASASAWGQSYSPGNPRYFTVGWAYKFAK